MESSSLSKARPGSPYRFTRVPSTNQGNWQYPSPSQTGYQTPTSSASSKASNGFAGRSLTPNRTGRAISSTPSSFTPQQKFRLSSIGNPVVQQQSDSFQRDDFLSRAKENVSVTVRFRPLKYYFLTYKKPKQLFVAFLKHSVADLAAESSCDSS
jgi:centromeric protein E